MASIMEADSSISSSLRRTDSQSLSDLYVDAGAKNDGEEVEDDDLSLTEEFLCPFCGDRYDVVSLCCHIDDQHPVDANNGVCPVCAKKVGMDLVGHVTKEHGNFSKVQHKMRFRNGGSNSILRKELREGGLPSLSGDSLNIASSDCEPDPLLLSFIFTPVVADEPLSAHPCPLEATQKEGSLKDDFLGRDPEQLEVLDKDQVEKARMFEFVHGLLMSAILEDNLSLKL